MRVVVRLAVAATLLLCLGQATSSPAGAHAVVVGTAPADKTRIEAVPDRVAIYLNAKPATVEGDPVAVLDPGGNRIDDGDVRVEEDGQILSVGVLATSDHPVMGDYEVVYRIISADSHIIAGTFGFHVHPHEEEAAAAPAPDESAPPGARAAAPAPTVPEGDQWLRRGGPLDVRPELVLVTAFAVIGALWARRLWAGSTRAPAGEDRV